MNRVTQILGSKYPIIQAPMGWSARSKLASAVSNAGGFGIIETSSGEVENCKNEIMAMADLTDKPFGVNLPLLFLKDESMIECSSIALLYFPYCFPYIHKFYLNVSGHMIKSFFDYPHYPLIKRIIQ